MHAYHVTFSASDVQLVVDNDFLKEITADLEPAKLNSFSNLKFGGLEALGFAVFGSIALGTIVDVLPSPWTHRDDGAPEGFALATGNNDNVRRAPLKRFDDDFVPKRAELLPPRDNNGRVPFKTRAHFLGFTGRYCLRKNSRKN